MESHARSIAKAVSYRVLGSASTVLILYALSRDIPMSLGAGALDTVVKIVMYFLHERLWARISFGKPKAPEYEI